MSLPAHRYKGHAQEAAHMDDEELRAEMSAADINDLPDSAFAYIEDGGEKDDDGRTTPRSLRHFPIHDEAHVRNALTRLSQSPFGEKAKAKVMAAAKKFGIDAEEKGVDEIAETRDETAERTGTPTARRKARHRAVPLTPEVRFFAPTQVEVRSQATADNPQITIAGAAIMYGAQYRVMDMFGEFRETIHPGAASRLVNGGVDCRLLLNHEGLPMARTTSGTMRLIDTPAALRFEANLDARQQLANDFAIAIERGDLSQMSIGMIVGRDKWGSDTGGETRDIFDLEDLLDVSGVTYACSETTHLEVAHRMAVAMPFESRARLRNMEADLRAGKTLSASNQGKLVEALKALHDLASAGGVDPANLGPGEDEDVPVTTEDGSQGNGANAESDAGITYPDGTGQRSQEEGETRDAPTPEDYGIAYALADAKKVLAGVKAKQLADPDNETDSDDATVMEQIEAAEAAIDKAITAQAKDGRSDPEPRAVTMKRSSLLLHIARLEAQRPRVAA